MNKLKKQKGFTLVELMVVIVIIGILAAMAITKFDGATNKTKATEFKPILKNIYMLQVAYHAEKDAYSANIDQIGFVSPTGDSRFAYTISADTAKLGIATLTVKIGDAAIGKKAQIDHNGIIKADSALAVIANVGSL